MLYLQKQQNLKMWSSISTSKI